MGGMESLLTIWLQVTNFKEKKFLMNDINQLESCLNQAQTLATEAAGSYQVQPSEQGPTQADVGPWDAWILACPGRQPDTPHCRGCSHPSPHI